MNELAEHQCCRSSRLPVCLGVFLVVVILLVPARSVRGDWLVDVNGTEIETTGSWSEQGNLLVFTLADGTLASLKKDTIDLEASRQLTEERRSVKTPPATVEQPVQRPKAVLVVTDADVRHVSSSQTLEPESPASEESREVMSDPVRVLSWDQQDLPDQSGIVVRGTARNMSDTVAAGLSLKVVAYGSDGKVQASAPATLGASALAPGQSTTLTAEFIGVFDIAGAKFEFGLLPVKTSEEVQAPQSTQRSEGSL